MQKTKRNKEMSVGFLYIAIGVCFLFNPNIHVIDILPDFIGILLLYRGLFVMSFSTEKLRDARTALWKLAIITALRFLSVLFLPGKTDSFTMLLVFVFGGLETIYLIPAILKIFDGLYDLGRRYDGQSVYDESRNRRGVSVERAERLKRYSIVFFLLKTVTAILPELTALQLTDEFSSTAQMQTPLTRFKPLFYIFFVSVTLVFGIIWLVRALRYIARLRRDESLKSGVLSYYRDNIAADAGISAALKMKYVMLLFIFAAVSFFPLQFDSVFVLPTAIPAAFLAWALCLLSRFDKLAVFGYIPAALAGGLSVYNLFLQIPYFAEYDAEAALYLTNAIRLYAPIRLIGTVEFVLELFLFVWFTVVLCRVFHRHVDLIGGGTYGLQYTAAARNKEIFAFVRARFIAAAAVGAVYLILRAVSFTASMYFSTFWFVHTAASVILVVCAVYAVSGATEMIYERLENKY